MPYMADVLQGTGQVGTEGNRVAYATIGGVHYAPGTRGVPATNTADTRMRGAAQSGPMTAVVQQALPAVLRRVAAPSNFAPQSPTPIPASHSRRYQAPPPPPPPPARRSRYGGNSGVMTQQAPNTATDSTARYAPPYAATYAPPPPPPPNFRANMAAPGQTAEAIFTQNTTANAATGAGALSVGGTSGGTDPSSLFAQGKIDFATLSSMVNSPQYRQQQALTSVNALMKANNGSVASTRQALLNPAGGMVDPEQVAAFNALVGGDGLGDYRTVRRSHASLLADYGEGSRGDTYLGFSLGSVIKNIGTAVKKAVVDTGHVTGSIVTSKIGQGILGTALAVTGVGIPAAAAIFAATKGVGTLIKPGGNLKGAVTGAAQGAVEGVISSGAGTVARGIIGKVTQSHASTGATAVAAAVATPIASTVLPSMANLPGISMTPSAAPTSGVDPYHPWMTQPPLINVAAPVAAQLPQIGQTAPYFPQMKRVQAAPTYPMQVNAAKKIMGAGTSANNAAKIAAGNVDAINVKLDAVQTALAAAAALGDKTGASQLTALADSLRAQVANAQNIAGGVSTDLRMAGGAIQGAADGAVSGAGLASLGAFIDSHKVLVYGGAAAAALGIALAIHKPSGGARAHAGR